MNCPKCGADNIAGSTFCIRCGTNIKEYLQQNNNSYVETPIKNESFINESINAQPVTVQSIEQTPQQSINNVPLNYMMYIIAIILRPFKSFKEEESKLLNPKTSVVFSIIISVSMMLITLIKTMISTVFTKSMDYSTFKMKTSIDFSNLKSLDWLSLVGKNLLIYAGIIFTITVVYYLASLVFKKTVSFIKFLSISATSVIPFVILGMIVSPLIGKIWAPLSIVSMVIGGVYSILIFINLINDSVNFDSGDKKIYFHLICLSILGVAGYYLYMKLFMSGLGSQISDILDMFK